MDHDTATASALSSQAFFIGPIEKVRIHGRGLGYVAKRDIRAGELLLREEAFVTTCATSGCSPGLHGDRVSKQGTAQIEELLELVLQKIEKHSSLETQILQLWGGAETDELRGKLDNPVSDASTYIRQVVAKNTFAYTTQPWRLFLERAQINCEDRQITHNATNIGIWVQASYLNHACLANSYRTFHGDTMIVRAVHDIDDGDEVSQAYCNPTLPYSIRQRILQQGWGFCCDCDLCLTESEWEESASDLSHKLLADLKHCLSLHSSFANMTMQDMRKLGDLMRLLDNGYRRVANTHDPCLPLIMPLLALTQTAARQRNAMEAKDYAHHLLMALGFKVSYGYHSTKVLGGHSSLFCELGIEALVHLCHACNYLNETDNFDQLKQELNQQCLVIFGTKGCVIEVLEVIGNKFWKRNDI